MRARSSWHSCPDLHFLNQAARVRLYPDIVWYRRDRSVADAKCKAEQPGGYPDADLYQILAYCTAINLPRGHLICARGADKPARYTVREAGIEVVAHALDLDNNPGKLLSQIRGLVSCAIRM